MTLPQDIGYVVDVESATRHNRYYRRVIYTGPHMQWVLMSLRPGTEIGTEIHPSTDQFLRVEEGRGTVILSKDGTTVYEVRIKDGDAVMIHAGVYHNVVNDGSKPLQLYVLYAPPEHAPNTLEQ